MSSRRRRGPAPLEIKKISETFISLQPFADICNDGENICKICFITIGYRLVCCSTPTNSSFMCPCCWIKIITRANKSKCPFCLSSTENKKIHKLIHNGRPVR